MRGFQLASGDDQSGTALANRSIGVWKWDPEDVPRFKVRHKPAYRPPKTTRRKSRTDHRLAPDRLSSRSPCHPRRCRQVRPRFQARRGSNGSGDLRLCLAGNHCSVPEGYHLSRADVSKEFPSYGNGPEEKPAPRSAWLEFITMTVRSALARCRCWMAGSSRSGPSSTISGVA
jgi:hypothetical protein